ncbi:hypothetical protein FA95DRAFT_1499617, partial [Auriscalpium vulgare]
FGVLKRKYPLPVSAPEFSLKTQAKLIPAISALFNFIRDHDPEDIDTYIIDPNEEPDSRHGPSESNTSELGQQITTAEREESHRRRDEIAQAMWDDYQAVLAERGEL